MNPSPVRLIFQRLTKQFRIVLLLVLGPVVLVLVVNFFVLLVVYVECWAFGKASYYYRIPHPGPVHTCTFDGRFHWN